MSEFLAGMTVTVGASSVEYTIQSIETQSDSSGAPYQMAFLSQVGSDLVSRREETTRLRRVH